LAIELAVDHHFFCCWGALQHFKIPFTGRGMTFQSHSRAGLCTFSTAAITLNAATASNKLSTDQHQKMLSNGVYDCLG
jgi:hypothetical protein